MGNFAPFWKSWGLQGSLGDSGLPVMLFAQLPPAGSLVPGSMIYASDRGLMITNGSAWSSSTSTIDLTANYTWTGTQSFGAGINVTGAGAVIGTPVGGDKGPGTVNATGFFLNGAALNFVPIYKFKPTTTARASNAVLSNDPDLTYAIPAIGVYTVHFSLAYNGTGSGAGGIQFRVNYTGTSASDAPTASIFSSAAALTISSSVTGPSINAVIAAFVTIQPNPAADIASFDCTFSATSVGTLSLQWAQNTSNANAANLRAFSTMTVTRIG